MGGSAIRVVAADFETGGLLASLHAPVTLGIAVMEGEEVVAGKEWIFAPILDGSGRKVREYTEGATKIHGYTEERLIAEGLPLRRVLDELTEFATEHDVRGRKTVAFNAPFDYGFYGEMLRLEQGYAPPLVGAWQCAMLLARNRLRLRRYNLDSVAGHFGLSRSSDKHGALEDAILAGRVYHRLSEEYAEARRLAEVGA